MSVIELLNSNSKKMSRIQKKIAGYIIENVYEASFKSLKEISQETNVAEATVLNFVKKMGFESFIQFKKELQEYVCNSSSPSEKTLSIANAYKSNSMSSLLKKVIDLDNDTVQRTINSINFDEISKAVQAIIRADTIYLVAYKSAQSLTILLKYRLRFLGFNVKEFEIVDNRIIAEQLINVKQSDLFIFASYPDYNINAVNLLELLKNKNIGTVSITDSLASPFAKHSDCCLIAYSDAVVFYNSYSAPALMINILLSALAFETKERHDEVRLKLDLYEKQLESISKSSSEKNMG